MATIGKAAHAAGYCQSNDHGCSEERIDNLVDVHPQRARTYKERGSQAQGPGEGVCRGVRGMPLRRRPVRMPRRSRIVRGRGGSYPHHVDPSLYDDVDVDDLDDTEDDPTGDDVPIDPDSDPFDEFCESEFCDGCCDECPIGYACIPVFVSDALEMRIVLRRRDSDD